MDDRQVSLVHVARAFRVEDERHARREVRLADEELAAAGDLDHDRGGGGGYDAVTRKTSRASRRARTPPGLRRAGSGGR